MTRGRLCRVNDEYCLIPAVSRTSNMLERMKGLLGTQPLQSSEGLLIKPCSSVHTIGMNYNIDLAFLDEQWTVIKTVSALKPWRMAMCPGASMVLELIDGNLKRLNLVPGIKLAWQNE